MYYIETVSSTKILATLKIRLNFTLTVGSSISGLIDFFFLLFSKRLFWNAQLLTWFGFSISVFYFHDFLTQNFRVRCCHSLLQQLTVAGSTPLWPLVTPLAEMKTILLYVCVTSFPHTTGCQLIGLSHVVTRCHTLSHRDQGFAREQVPAIRHPSRLLSFHLTAHYSSLIFNNSKPNSSSLLSVSNNNSSYLALLTWTFILCQASEK